MYLEQRIDSLTDEIRQLREDVLKALARSEASGVSTVVPPEPPGAVETTKPEDVNEELTYDKDIRPLTLKYVKEKGREQALMLLQGFNVRSAAELTPAQWADYIKACGEVPINGRE